MHAGNAACHHDRRPTGNPSRPPTIPLVPDPSWYSSGLRFECTMCGRCCTGPAGYILFTDDEARAIARRLGITVEDFLARYTHDMGAAVAGRRRSFNEVETPHGRDCVFLDRRSVPGKALCSIHDLRPVQCRTFPFWPEHLESRESWESLARTCEGIGRGSVVPFVEITIQRRAHERDREGA